MLISKLIFEIYLGSHIIAAMAKPWIQLKKLSWYTTKNVVAIWPNATAQQQLWIAKEKELTLCTTEVLII